MTILVEGKNLFLRKLERTDLNRTWEWLHRADIHLKIGVLIPFTKEQQLAWFQDLVSNETKIVFAICLNQDHSHIGNVSLDMIDFRHRNARLSIFIANQDSRGKSYGSEALKLLEQYAFSNLNLHKIWCKTDVCDADVLRFYEKLGFNQEGLLCEHENKDGHYVDKVLFAKISTDLNSS